MDNKESITNAPIIEHAEINEKSTNKEVNEYIDDQINKSIEETIGIYDYALTTIDNLFDPLDDFDRWFTRDNDLGYHTIGYLARVANTTPLMTEKQIDEETLRAMKVIVYNDPLNIYTIVKKKRKK